MSDTPMIFPSPSPPRASNTRTIAKNSLWAAFDLGFGYLLVLLTSIPIARKFGPASLGYFSFLILVTRMSSLLGMMGIPIATRKYMAEYLGRGESTVVRAIFYTALRIQTGLAFLITTAGLILVYTVGDPAYRSVSAVMVLAIFPFMLLAIPSHTNTARESYVSNIPGNLAGMTVYVIVVTLSLTLDWGLVGVASGLFLYRVAEFILKFIPVRRWVNQFPSSEIPPELWARMKTYSVRTLLLMGLDLIVWDRSDIFFLKYLVKDISQISFYTLPINLTEQAIQIPAAFAQAIGMTLFVQYGRNKKELYNTVGEAVRYMALLAVPLLLGMSALSGAGIRILYGSQYLPAIPALALASLLALPRSLASPAQGVMMASEKQPFLVRWTLLCCGVNIFLDCVLIPPLGAMGAVIANGTAQTLASVGIWTKALKLYPLPVDTSSLKKIALSGLVMCAAVAPLNFLLPPWPAVCIGIPGGAAVFFSMLRLTGALNQRDRERFLLFRRSVPAGLRSWFDRLLGLLIPASQEPLERS